MEKMKNGGFDADIVSCYRLRYRNVCLMGSAYAIYMKMLGSRIYGF